MKSDIKISKRLSFWLRHQPENAELALTKDGWAKVDEVLRAFQAIGITCNRPTLERVVETNDKALRAF